jgi:hypothetical protein
LKKKAENPENRAAVTAALRDVTGRRWRLSYELHEGLELDDGELSEEEWLKRFIDEFDAEELPGENAPAGGAGEPGDAEQSHGEPVTSEQKGA